jgi:hypothetical protein
MKKLVLLLFALCAFSANVCATSVQVATTQIPNFNPVGLSDVTLNNISVTNGSATVTSANLFRSEWIGLGGFKILINGVSYDIAGVASRSSLTLSTTYAGMTSSAATLFLYRYVELRIYVDPAAGAFRPLGESYIVQPSDPSSGVWYRRVAASVINSGSLNTLFIPAVTLDATTDSPTNNLAKYSAAFYTAAGGLIQQYTCFEQFSLPPVSPTNWADVCTYNRAAIYARDADAYTTDQINLFLPSCGPNSLDYFAVTGRSKRCLAIGTGLSIAGDTLNASGGGGGLADPGSNGLVVRTALNTTVARTLLGVANETVVVNGDGVPGNPMVGLASTINLSAKTSVIPFPVGTAPPGTCSIGQYFFDSNETGGRNTYACTATDTWTLQSGGIADPGSNGIVVRTGAGVTVSRQLVPSLPIVITNPTGVGGNPIIEIGPTINFSAKTSVIPWTIGSLPPATCTQGQYFFDNDEIAGRNTYACTSTDTWTLQGDGGGGGGSPGGVSGNVQFNNVGVLGGISGANSDDGTRIIFNSGKLLATAPMFDTGIFDFNLNEIFLFTPAPSAVNEFTVANAPAGNSPTLSSSGNDTDISLTLLPKGIGAVWLSGNAIINPSSGTTGIGVSALATEQLAVTSLSSARVANAINSASNSSVNLVNWNQNVSNTNTIANLATFDSQSNGTAAAGFGQSFTRQLESSTTNGQVAMLDSVRWKTATHASRSSIYSISTVDNAITSERMLIAPRLALADNIAATVFSVNLPNNSGAGGIIKATIVGQNTGAAVVVWSGVVAWGAVAQSSTVTGSVSVLGTPVNVNDGSGTATVTWSTTVAANTLNVRVTADLSFTPSVGEFYIVYQVEKNLGGAITIN